MQPVSDLIYWFFQHDPAWAYRSVRNCVPCIVDPNPPGREGLVRRMRDNVRRIGSPLLHLVDQRYRKVMVQRKAADKTPSALDKVQYSAWALTASRQYRHLRRRNSIIASRTWLVVLESILSETQAMRVKRFVSIQPSPQVNHVHVPSSILPSLSMR